MLPSGLQLALSDQTQSFHGDVWWCVLQDEGAFEFPLRPLERPYAVISSHRRT